jgi:hypothetical protein
MTGLDATLGYGGHTKAMLEKLEGNGHIYALDVDPIESAKTKERLASQGFGEEILTVRLQNFADIDLVSKETGKKLARNSRSDDPNVAENDFTLAIRARNGQAQKDAACAFLGVNRNGVKFGGAAANTIDDICW